MKRFIIHAGAVALMFLSVQALECSSTSKPKSLIQKIQKVSKIEDGKEWTVTIYEYDHKLPTQGKQVSQSKFKKDTGGLFTNKLHFDFTHARFNRILYGPKGQRCEVIIPRFEPVKDLKIELTQDVQSLGRCKVIFTPEVNYLPLEQQVLEQMEFKKVEFFDEAVEVPFILPLDLGITSWNIRSGDFTKLMLRDPDKYTLDKKEIKPLQQDKNTYMLKIYKNAPTKIAIMKNNKEPWILSTIDYSQYHGDEPVLELSDKPNGSKLISKQEAEKIKEQAKIDAVQELRILLMGDANTKLPASLEQTKYYQELKAKVEGWKEKMKTPAGQSYESWLRNTYEVSPVSIDTAFQGVLDQWGKITWLQINYSEVKKAKGITVQTLAQVFLLKLKNEAARLTDNMANLERLLTYKKVT